MKGKTKIIVKTQIENNPEEVFVLSSSCYIESINEWIDFFKKILFCVGFDIEIIENVFTDVYGED